MNYLRVNLMKKQKKIFYFGALLSVSLFSTMVSAADIEAGKHTFNQNCALCHGKQADKSALNQSAIIKNLKKEEIITALQERKAGNIKGAGNMPKSRLSEQDMENIAEYLQTLK
ncbi:Cytochrome c-554(547) [Canicola haemoglobinophilus]|uniref:Cytochrome c-554(547) n=2 Tax=Canicola haemoglobinophilus TaxID=733 RepID=A0A377HWW3_9PAST|nr:Cytochrome c-554(547) [Canicola haemoglobinophilus]